MISEVDPHNRGWINLTEFLSLKARKMKSPKTDLEEFL